MTAATATRVTYTPPGGAPQTVNTTLTADALAGELSAVRSVRIAWDGHSPISHAGPTIADLTLLSGDPAPLPWESEITIEIALDGGPWLLAFRGWIDQDDVARVRNPAGLWLHQLACSDVIARAAATVVTLPAFTAGQARARLLAIPDPWTALSPSATAPPLAWPNSRLGATAAGEVNLLAALGPIALSCGRVLRGGADGIVFAPIAPGDLFTAWRIDPGAVISQWPAIIGSPALPVIVDAATLTETTRTLNRESRYSRIRRIEASGLTHIYLAGGPVSSAMLDLETLLNLTAGTGQDASSAVSAWLNTGRNGYPGLSLPATNAPAVALGRTHALPVRWPANSAAAIIDLTRRATASLIIAPTPPGAAPGHVVTGGEITLDSRTPGHPLVLGLALDLLPSERVGARLLRFPDVAPTSGTVRWRPRLNATPAQRLPATLSRPVPATGPTA